MKPAYLALPNGWLTVAESALLLGVSKVALYKALNVGRLEYRTIEGRKCIEAKDLKNRYWGSSQRLADRPAHGLASPMAELSDADLEAAMRPINEWIDAQQRAPQWDLVAARLNEYLGDWPGSPWTAEEVNTLAMALAMAQEATDG